jgi:copper chaperone
MADYVVTGMTCEHCERAVEGEVVQIPGVEAATASADTGRLVVTTNEPVDHDLIVAAVAEAGYTAAPA